MLPLLFTFHVLSVLPPVLFDPSSELYFSLYIPHIPAVSKCSVLWSFFGLPPHAFTFSSLCFQRLFFSLHFCYIPGGFVLMSSLLSSLRVPSAPQGFFGRPLRGRFSTVLLSRYLTMMLCTVDLGILSSSPMAPSDLPSFQRSTTRCRCTTSCSLVFWKAAVGPPAAPPAAPPVAPAAAAASVGADKRQTVVETRRGEQDNVTLYWSP